MDPVKDANGWTGGQWSLVRATLAMAAGAIVIFMPFAEGVDGGLANAWIVVLTLFVVATVCFGHVAGAVLSLLAILGAFVWALRPVITEIAGQSGAVRQLRPTHVAHLLLATTFWWMSAVGPAPYGTLAARRRADPGGGWQLPRWIHRLAALAWLAYVISLSYAVTVALGWWPPANLAPALHRSDWFWVLGDARLPDYRWTVPPTLLIPLHVFVRPLRPYIWLVAVAFLVVACWSLAWWLILAEGAAFALLAFDPGWIRPRRAETTDTLFYDGGCGLCHTSVRFILAEDRSGTAFRFAPIGDAAWREAFPDERTAPAQTLVVRTARGETLSRSTGALYIARRLGGFWRVFGTLGLAIPRPLRDLVYNAVARVRHRLFRAPSEACPLVPPEMRARFDLRA